MQLVDLLKDIKLLAIKGSLEISVSSPTFDSRVIEPGGVYVAVPGTQVDGHSFIGQAVANGAGAIVCEQFPDELQSHVTYIEVSSASAALGEIASNFFDRPSSKLRLVGVTGTNGKTTTVTLLADMFSALGFKVGLLSTIKNQINGVIIESTHTTPDAIQINDLMNDMVKEGCEYCFMEVTSHAVVQNRIGGLSFAGGVFTNLSQDHMDYHKTIDSYFAAKKTFFDYLPPTSFALTNVDDKYGRLIMADTVAQHQTYGIHSPADFICEVIQNSISGLTLKLDGLVVEAKLRGRFNAYNILAAYSSAVILGINKSQVISKIPQLEVVNGRFDFVQSVNGITGVVDFAHTPDGLEKILMDLREFKSKDSKILTVIGCGGDRDQEKRPLMGKIAVQGSNIVILTSDNPRTEDPLVILEHMKKLLPHENGENLVVMPDRKEAIDSACKMASTGDIILVAGKGHENYQIVGNRKIPFNDKEQLQLSLQTMQNL